MPSEVGAEDTPDLICECLAIGPRHPNVIEERQVGTDETDGRFADVTVRACRACERLWIRYQVAYEGFSRSGRWAEALIDQEKSRHISPERTAHYIESQPWYVFGGSYWGHSGKRGLGPLRWGP